MFPYLDIMIMLAVVVTVASLIAWHGIRRERALARSKAHHPAGSALGYPRSGGIR